MRRPPPVPNTCDRDSVSCWTLERMQPWGRLHLSPTVERLIAWTVVAFLGLAVASSNAQTQRRLQKLTTEDGLRSDIVYSILQDSRGYMWFGTDAGILRWDGYDFESMTPRVIDSPALRSVPVNAIYEDGDAGFLLATGGGLIRINSALEVQDIVLPADRVDTLPTSASEAEYNWLSGVYEAPSEPGVLWLATFGAGLYRWDRLKDEVTLFVHDPSDSTTIADRYLVEPFEDRKGNFWVPTSSGLDRMDRKSGTFHHVTSSPIAGRLLEDLDEDGVLWIPERNRLIRYDPSTGVKEIKLEFDVPDHLRTMRTVGGVDVPYWAMPQSTIWDMQRRGVMWIAAGAAGLVRYDVRTGVSETYTRSSITVTQDHTGAVWDGVPGYGVFWLNPQEGRAVHYSVSSWQHPHDADVPTGRITALTEGSQNGWWVGEGSSASGYWLLTFNPETGERREWLHSDTPGQVGRQGIGRIQALLEDDRGVVWIGAVDPSDWTRGGLYRLEPGTDRLGPQAVGTDNAEPHEGGVTALMRDRSGTIWASTYGNGVLRVDPGSNTVRHFDSYLDSQGQSGYWGLTSYQDLAGNIWVSTLEGLCKLDPNTGSCENFAILEDTTYVHRLLWARVVQCMVERRHEPGILWLGTASGLFRFDTQNGQIGRAPSEMLLDDIRVLLATTDGLLVVGAEGAGVLRYDPDAGSVAKLSTSAPSRTISFGAGFLGRAGEVVVGYEGWGISVFDAVRLRGNTTPPRVVIAKVITEDETFAPDGSLEEGSEARIELPYRQSSFIVEFIGLHFTDPRRNEYSILVEGIHNDWQFLGRDRRAVFGRLAPGEYVFRVRAANSDGVWNQEGASTGIVVLPPWWATRWAYLVYAILVVAVLVAAARIQRTRIRVETAELQARLAAEHAQQVEELDAARSRFFTNISHEFRTPLTVIMGPLREWSERGGPGQKERVRTQSSMMLRNAQRLLRLINQLLDLAKVESGPAEIDPQDGDLVPFLRDVTRSFVPLAETKPIELQFEAKEPTIPVRFDANALEKIVVNLLSNAVKFTDAGGKVSLSVEASDRDEFTEVVVKVRDTGVGIPPSEIDSIFERFHQADVTARKTHEGTGIGLALCRELVERHGGALEVESKVGFGSTFTVRIGMERSREREQEMMRPSASEVLALESAILEADAVGHTDDEAMAQQPGRDRTFEATILIVDDNSDVRAYLRDHLAARYRVLEAADGAEGLAQTRESVPDMVISDVMMPGIDGYELCRKIKSSQKLQHVPVILLTARVEEEDRIRGLEMGADDYLNKPFSTRELEVRVMNLLLSRRKLREQFSRELWVRSPEIAVQPEEEMFMEKVLAAMNHHLGDANFSTDMLADAVALSRRQVERKVKHITGDTPPEFLRKMRLERAADILRKAPGSISEVAYAVGFKSPSHFTVAFKKSFGVTPSKFADIERTDVSAE